MLYNNKIINDNINLTYVYIVLCHLYYLIYKSIDDNISTCIVCVIQWKNRSMFDISFYIVLIQFLFIELININCCCWIGSKHTHNKQALYWLLTKMIIITDYWFKAVTCKTTIPTVCSNEPWIRKYFLIIHTLVKPVIKLSFQHVLPFNEVNPPWSVCVISL